MQLLLAVVGQGLQTLLTMEQAAVEQVDILRAGLILQLP